MQSTFNNTLAVTVPRLYLGCAGHLEPAGNHSVDEGFDIEV